MTDNLEDNDFEIDENYKEFNIEDFKKNISNLDSESLCARIACDRYFKSFKELSIICMEELAARRIAGDDYNFEDDIDNKFNLLNEANKLEFTLPDLGDVLRQVINKKSAK
jgi:hypothetical protein